MWNRSTKVNNKDNWHCSGVFIKCFCYWLSTSECLQGNSIILAREVWEREQPYRTIMKKNYVWSFHKSPRKFSKSLQHHQKRFYQRYFPKNFMSFHTVHPIEHLQKVASRMTKEGKHRHATLLIRDSNTGVLVWNLRNF